MLKDYFVLLTFCNSIAGFTTEQDIHVDGWIPVTREQVYNQIRRQWPQNVLYTSVIPSKVHTHDIQPENQLKNTNNEELAESDEQTTFTVNTVISTDSETNIDEKFNEPNTLETPRKARKLVKILIQNETLGNHAVDFKQNIEDHKYKTANEITLIKASDKYDVTEENTESFGDANEDSEEEIGYQYDSPIEETENLTTKFKNILSKYNINNEDKLTNYDLSRQPKTKNSLTPLRHKPFYHHTYNSLNHLPVDPILAVLLSNYGFYLPSLYGIKSNYNNLYGYLASNNIHNNKPFGFYKIFSDTDSSN